MKRIVLISVLFSFVFLSHAQIWKVPEGHETRWTSFENPTGAKGTAAQANKGAKGSAFGRIMAGDSCVLLSQQGPGIINRIWLTVSKRNPKMLRALRIKFYWDNSVVPAVDVPLGDFFGNPLSRTSRFENCFFSNPEKRSFNCCIPMPYRTGAKVVFVNTSDEDLTHLFYDINFTKLPEWDSEMSYFHAVWREDKSTKLGVDYTVLPQLSGMFFKWAKAAEEKGFKVIIAGAGKAAHLPGMCAALFPMPVIGIPMKTSDLGGVDSLYSIVQMPSGIPVATVAINGGLNAGILAAKILATSDEKLLEKLEAYSEEMKQSVVEKAEKLDKVGYKDYE